MENKTEEVSEKIGETQARADWFRMMARKRQDFMEQHPNSSGLLANMQEFAMFTAAAAQFSSHLAFQADKAKLREALGRILLLAENNDARPKYTVHDVAILTQARAALKATGEAE